MVSSRILNLIPHTTAFAHCDIPCGIYDVQNLQMAAHTIYRMTVLLGQIKREDELKTEHDVVRVTRVKEEHVNILEHELSTLQDDYFKNDLSKYEGLEGLFNSAKIVAGKCRTGIDASSCEELIEISMKISEVFYDSKNVKHKRVKSVFPTEKEIVVLA